MPIATLVALTSLVLPFGASAGDPAQAEADFPASTSTGSVLPAIRNALNRQASAALPPAKFRAAAPANPVVAVVPSDGKRHMVEIGAGRRLAIWCQGTGSPTVILEHGLGYGIDSDSWPTVQKGVAATTRVCRYDRADVGFSDDAKSGRTMPDLAADLRALLKASGIPGPYILVGHSFGGLTVRYYAMRYPADVAGIVLVDGSPPSAITNLDLGSERLNRPKVLSQLKTLKPLGSIPLVVITRGIGLSASWREAQEDMVELSTRGRQVIATSSDHWIQLRQPDLVIRQIGTVIGTVQRNALKNA